MRNPFCRKNFAIAKTSLLHSLEVDKSDLALVLAFVFLAFVVIQSVVLFGLGLAFCGFMLMGPDSLLSGVGALDVAGRANPPVAAGLINGLDSIGPIVQEEMLGYVLTHHGYRATFYLLLGVATLGVVATAFLTRRCRQGRAQL